MHKPVRMFSHDGFIKDDKDFIRIKSEFERIIIDQMRDQGCLPIHEMSTHWSTQWLDNKYSFKITMYGWYAGKKKSREYDFWCEGRLIKIG